MDEQTDMWMDECFFNIQSEEFLMGYVAGQQNNWNPNYRDGWEFFVNDDLTIVYVYQGDEEE